MRSTPFGNISPALANVMRPGFTSCSPAPGNKLIGDIVHYAAIPMCRLPLIAALLVLSTATYLPVRGDDATKPAADFEYAGDVADWVAPRQDGAWSKPVEGLRARILLKWTEVFEGTPMISTFLEFQNVSDVMGGMMVAWRREKMKFRVLDAQGHEPSQPQGVGGHSGPRDGQAGRRSALERNAFLRRVDGRPECRR